MIAIAKNLGEAPIFYCDRLAPNDDGTVTAVTKDGNASQQPTAGQPYESAYGRFNFVPQNAAWERATLNGAILSYTVNGEKFGYVWF